MQQQVKRLTDTLAEETKRRKGAEQQAAEIGQRRSELEAELTKNKQAQARLQHDLEVSQKQLQTQQESSRAEQCRLEARTQQLQTTQAEVEQQVKRLTETLTEETKRRKAAEQQAADTGQRRSELEAQLTENKQAQTRLQHDLEASQRQLQAQQESSLAEQSRLEARTQQLQAAQAEVEQQVKRLTETLAEETNRRKGAEQHAAEIGQRRSELEAQLTDNKQAQTRLQHDLETSQKQLEVQRAHYIAEQSKLESRTREFQALTNELAAVRTGIEEQSLQRRKLAEKVVEVERARAELATQANAACDLVKAQENSIRSLDSQVQERKGEVDRLESLLQSEISQRRREQLQAETLEKQAAELADQLAEKVAEQQRWHQRESELEQSICRQKDQLANSAAAATIQEVELSNLRSTNDELHVIQSSLCARVRELTTQHDAASRQIHELDGQSQAAVRTIQARDQELAALRHAILDAARIGSNISRERLQAECQVVDGWKRMITTLLHTPLSMAQRGLVSQITCALEGWRKGRADATNGVEFQVEPPDLHHSEFNCAEVIECALAAVRKNADETGAKVQTALVGPVPECLHGNAQHIHQLLTMLAASLPDVASAENLDLQVSFGAKQNGTAEMLLSFFISSTDSDETLCRRLTTLTEASASLRTVRREGPELVLTAAWQLALALGGSPSIEKTANQKVLVRISLPLLAASSPFAGNGTV